MRRQPLLRSASPVPLGPGHIALLLACWAFTVIGGLAQAWNHRFSMNPDGVSYLEIGEAFWRFDLANAINGYWNPLYPIVLGLVDAIARPPAAWEFQVVHLANFLIYILALAAFNLLLFGLIDRNRSLGSDVGRAAGIPTWAWLVLGHGVFVWTTCFFTKVQQVNNDLLSLALMVAVAAVFVRLEGRPVGARGALFLGCVIGLCYLSKLAIVWPALLFLGGLAIVNRRVDRPWRILGLGLLGCGLVAAPFVCALSIQKGRFTLGDKGRLAYAWIVNDVEWVAHWQGEPPGSGVAVHPTRQLAEHPAVFEFASPVAGTYPPWYDPSYWYEGVEVQLDWRRQWRTIRTHTWPQVRTMFGRRPVVLVVGGLVALPLIGGLLLGSARRGCAAFASQIALGLPPLAGTLMYLPVHVLARYYGVFVLLLGMTLLAAVRLPAAKPWRLAALGLLVLYIGLLTAVVAPTIWREVDQAATDLRQHGFRDLSSHSHLRVAERLLAEGLAEGDRIAHIGNSFFAHWARLGRFKIVAEVPYRLRDRWKRDYTRQFQRLDEEGRAGILRALASPGVAAIVATNMPRRTRFGARVVELPEDWKQGWKTIVDGEKGLFASSLYREDGSVYLYEVQGGQR